MENDIARLRWRCRRGMRELDAVLQTFLERAYPDLDSADKERFEQILDLTEPELYGYLLGRDVPADPAVAALIERIRTTFKP
jgi:antitoxin CptB